MSSSFRGGDAGTERTQFRFGADFQELVDQALVGALGGGHVAAHAVEADFVLHEENADALITMWGFFDLGFVAETAKHKIEGAALDAHKTLHSPGCLRNLFHEQALLRSLGRPALQEIVEKLVIVVRVLVCEQYLFAAQSVAEGIERGSLFPFRRLGT